VPYDLHVDGVSDIGKIRKRNEDSLGLFPELGVTVVADGMGGHPGGDVASQLAAETMGEFLHGRLPLSASVRGDRDGAAAHLGQTMEAGVMEAHRAIRARGTKDVTLARMGTTLTALAVDTLTGVFAIGHVGDSRIYRFRNGALLQLTRDDTWVQERLENEDLTPEQAKRHPFGHLLTQCVGLEDAPEPHVVTGTVDAGDTYLLCTDGLMGMVEDEALTEAIEAGGTPRSIAQSLVDTANENGGRDNVTVAVVSVRSRQDG
jgi:protein phosphatase